MNNNQGDNRPPQQGAANHGGRAMKAAQGNANQLAQLQQPPPPPPPPQKCPRCDSNNTKFCYYNNYSLSQPRYFCKACRRYWTQGGTLRNVPVGGGCRKVKRPKLSPPPANQHGDLRLSRPPAPVVPPSVASSSTTRPSLSSQAGLMMGSLTSGGGYRHHLQQTLRAANPLTNARNNWPNLYNAGSSLGSTGLFSSTGMTQSFPPQANPNVTGMGTQFGTGGHMALLQGMNNFQLKPQASGAQQQMMATMTPQQAAQQGDHHQFVGSQIQQRPLGSWTQGFVNSSGAANSASMAASASFWGGDNNAVVGDLGGSTQSAAANSVFNPNQWANNGGGNQQQTFDPPR